MTDLCEIANQAIRRAEEIARMKGSLRMICGKCTREEYFPGLNRQDSISKARVAGWVYDPVRDNELCKNCLR